MKYTIHGKQVVLNGECGIYKPQTFDVEYAVMSPNRLVDAINSLPKDKAITAVMELRDEAAAQAKWTSVPENFGFPILIRTGAGPTPIDEVRANIQNLERFTSDILKALNGE